jgi:ubiquinone/menaquinone biosynthesis C-methylase UbiE
MTSPPANAQPRSLVIHSAARHYDLLAWLLTLGRERQLRERLVDLARLQPGEVVLDVGCGTGSLALAAKRRVGSSGTVRGVEASPEMISQARRKAVRAQLAIDWEIARAEALPCSDASVDVVLSTLMMHHLPRSVRETFATEIRRVLKPGGRVLVIDFEPPGKRRGGLISRFHRHGHVPARDIQETLRRADLRLIDVGSVGASDLHFALAIPSQREAVSDAIAPPPRSLPSLPFPRWPLIATGIVVVLGVHALLLRMTWQTLTIGSIALAGAVAAIALHGGIAGVAGMLFGSRHGHR